MCTIFTLTYACSHTQVSHRCSRSTISISTPEGERRNHVAGCENKIHLGNTLREDCVECKMNRACMPGVQTGVDRWARWGPREEAVEKRQRERERCEDAVEQGMDAGGVMGVVEGAAHGGLAGDNGLAGNSGLTGGEMVSEWGVPPGYQMPYEMGMGIGAPTTMGMRGLGGNDEVMFGQPRAHGLGGGEQEKQMDDDDDDDWMFGGMKAFGGEAIGKGEQAVPREAWEDGREGDELFESERPSKHPLKHPSKRPRI